MQSDASFQKDLKTYKNEIKSKLICDSKVSKKFFEDLQSNIDNYIADNNATSIEEIYKHFGTADEIAKAFFETTDISTIKKKISVKRLIAVFVVCVIVIVAIGVTIATIDANKNNSSYTNFYPVEEVSDIEEIQEDIR